MRNKQCFELVRLLMLGLLGVSAVFAVPINVTVGNAGFEDPLTSPSGYVLPGNVQPYQYFQNAPTEGSMTPGVWYASNAPSSGGAWNASVYNGMFVNPHGGQNVAYVENTGWISQVLSIDPTPGAAYSLSVWVGRREDNGTNYGQYQIELLSGSTTIASSNSGQWSDSAGITGTLGNRWMEVVSSGVASAASGPLTIRIRGNGSVPTHLIVDDVSLTEDIADASAVPEPGTIALLGSGFAGLFLLRRRIAKK